MFEQSMSLLLHGEFVCPVRYPDAYRFLAEEAHQRDADAFLARIGRRLAKTALGGAWYMAYDQVGQEERRAIRDEFTPMKQDIRFLVDFFVKAMSASGRQDFYSRGDTISANALMAAIEDNPGLRAEFQSLASLGRGGNGDGKFRTVLARQLRYLKDEGYLIEANPEREIYQVTGKIEYLIEVVQFLMNNDSIADDVEEPDTGNMDLF